MSAPYDIHTLWFWRKGEDGPELIEAWDDFTVDANPSGWEAACDKAWGSVKEDDSGGGPRRITITVDFDPIESAFFPVEIEGAAASSLVTPGEERGLKPAASSARTKEEA